MFHTPASPSRLLAAEGWEGLRRERGKGLSSHSWCCVLLTWLLNAPWHVRIPTAGSPWWVIIRMNSSQQGRLLCCGELHLWMTPWGSILGALPRYKRPWYHHLQHGLLWQGHSKVTVFHLLPPHASASGTYPEGLNHLTVGEATALSPSRAALARPQHCVFRWEFYSSVCAPQSPPHSPQSWKPTARRWRVLTPTQSPQEWVRGQWKGQRTGEAREDSSEIWNWREFSLIGFGLVWDLWLFFFFLFWSPPYGMEMSILCLFHHCILEVDMLSAFMDPQPKENFAKGWIKAWVAPIFGEIFRWGFGLRLDAELHSGFWRCWDMVNLFFIWEGQEYLSVREWAAVSWIIFLKINTLKCN